MAWFPFHYSVFFLILLVSLRPSVSLSCFFLSSCLSLVFSLYHHLLHITLHHCSLLPFLYFRCVVVSFSHLTLCLSSFHMSRRAFLLFSQFTSYVLILSTLHTTATKGFYTYFATDGFTYGSTLRNWSHLARDARQHGLAFVPCVGPGYEDTAVRPWNAANTRQRCAWVENYGEESETWTSDRDKDRQIQQRCVLKHMPVD